MNAPTFIEKNLGKQRDIEKQMELHNKKLKEIQDRDSKKKKVVNDKNMSSKLKDNKTKTHVFMKSEKTAEINRENQILLNKLVEISNGKWSSVSKAPKVVKKKEPVNKKSLNYERRKKEFERIERENMAIAQRLFNKQGSISKKKMDEEYGVNRKYKKQIQKLEPSAKPVEKKKGAGGKGEKDEDNKEEAAPNTTEKPHDKAETKKPSSADQDDKSDDKNNDDNASEKAKSKDNNSAAGSEKDATDNDNKEDANDD